MFTANSISGGKTSGYMAVHYPADVNIFACVCIDYLPAKPKDKAVLSYCLDKLNGNFIASAESEKTLKVMMQLEQLIGKEIVWVRGKSFDEVIDGAGCLPTWNRRFCTTDMKIIPMFEYLYFTYGVVKMNIGFRADEFERVHLIEKDKKPIKKIIGEMNYPTSCKNFGLNRQNWEAIIWQEKNYPLFDDMIYHLPILSWWAKHHPEFEFPKDSNCQGCHHKPKELIKKNYVENPEILDWFALQELKGKYNTWHDDMIPYRDTFKMNFTEEFDFDFTMCNSGGCTD